MIGTTIACLLLLSEVGFASEEKIMEEWPFDQTERTAAITTRLVLEEKNDICVVIHYDDDHSWALLCGTTNDEKDGRVIGMGEAVKIDPSLLELADLPPGWEAWRGKKGDEMEEEKE